VAYDVDKLISTARKRLAQCRAAEQEIREEAKIDLEFLVGKPRSFRGAVLVLVLVVDLLMWWGILWTISALFRMG
jgi:hypothetical protein